MPRVLDRFLWREAFWLFWAGLFTFVFVLVSSRVIFEVFDQLYTLRLAQEVVWRLFLTQLPKLALDALPGALLFAVFLSAGRQSREMETPAMFWGGVFPGRLMLPYLALALLLAGLLWTFRERVVIPTQVERQKLLDVHINQSQGERVQNNVALRMDGERMIYARTLDTETGAMQFVLVMRQKAGEITGFLTAPQATWKGETLTLHGGVNGNLDKGAFAQGEKTADRVLNVGRPLGGSLAANRDPGLLTLAELKQQIRFRALGGLEHRELLTERAMRYSFPFSCLVIVLITLPLAQRLGRQEQLVNAVLSVFFVSFYWGVMAVARGLAAKGAAEPFLGQNAIVVLAWSQNALLLLLGSAILLAHRVWTR